VSAGWPTVGMVSRRLGNRDNERVAFFDDNLKTVAESTYTDKKASKHGAFFCSYSVITAHGDTGRWKFYDRRGQKHGQLDVPILYDDATGIILSDAGTFLELQPRAYYSDDSAGVILHKLEGGSYRTVMIRKSGQLERAELSADGQFVALLASTPEDRYRFDMFIYNSDGQQVGRFIPQERQYSFTPRLSISDDCSFAVVTYGSRNDTATYLLRRNATVIARIPNSSPTRVKFSSSGRYACIIAPSNRMRLVETSTGRILFDYHRVQVIQECDIAERGGIVGLVGRERIVVLDFNGNEIWSALVALRTPQGLLKISVSDDGREIVSITGTLLSVFERVQ